MNVLPRETQIRIVAALVEGCSIRSTERMLDVHRDTIMRLGLAIGERCAKLHDRLFRDLNVSVLSRERPFAQTNPATTPTADGVDLLENYTNINRQLRDYFP